MISADLTSVPRLHFTPHLWYLQSFSTVFARYACAAIHSMEQAPGHSQHAAIDPMSSEKTGPSATEWERVKPIVRRLYREEKRPLRDVVAILDRDFGFRATYVSHHSKNDRPETKARVENACIKPVSDGGNSTRTSGETIGRRWQYFTKSARTVESARPRFSFTARRKLLQIFKSIYRTKTCQRTNFWRQHWTPRFLPTCDATLRVARKETSRRTRARVTRPLHRLLSKV